MTDACGMQRDAAKLRLAVSSIDRLVCYSDASPQLLPHAHLEALAPIRACDEASSRRLAAPVTTKPKKGGSLQATGLHSCLAAAGHELKSQR